MNDKWNALRGACIKAIGDCRCSGRHTCTDDFEMRATPPLVLELLDELAAAETVSGQVSEGADTVIKQLINMIERQQRAIEMWKSEARWFLTEGKREIDYGNSPRYQELLDSEARILKGEE